MTIAITPAGAGGLSVLGETLRPLTPGYGGIEIFETSGPAQAGPPPHRHPWEEIYFVLEGTLELFDDGSWSTASAGATGTVPPNQVHSYRLGSAETRFLTITGPGAARQFFEEMDAEITTLPPDIGRVLKVAGRNGLDVVLPG